MSTMLFVLNRYIAPFAFGICMAALATVDAPISVACYVGLAGVFAFLSFKVGNRMIERITGSTA